MSNLVHNARINLQARFYYHLGLLVLGISFVVPIVHPGLSEASRAVVFGGGALFATFMLGGSYLILGRLKD